METQNKQLSISKVIAPLGNGLGDIDFYVCMDADGTLRLTRRPFDVVLLDPEKLHDLRALAYNMDKQFSLYVINAITRRLASIG